MENDFNFEDQEMTSLQTCIFNNDNSILPVIKNKKRNNKIFKTFCFESKKEQIHPFKIKTPKNVKKISFNNQKNNKISQEKKTSIQNVALLNSLNKKHSIYSDEYKLLFTDYDKNKNKLFNKKMDIIDKIYHNNINFITTNFIKPFNFKLSEQKKKN